MIRNLWLAHPGLASVAAAMLLGACASQMPKAPPAAAAIPPSEPVEVEAPPPSPQAESKPSGKTYASYYAQRFHGRQTASGSMFDNNGLYAAHRSWPFGTQVKVTNLDNDKSVVVEVCDRGPCGANRRKGVTIDLSRAAARQLDMIEDGITPVRLEVIGSQKEEFTAGSKAVGTN